VPPSFVVVVGDKCCPLESDDHRTPGPPGMTPYGRGWWRRLPVETRRSREYVSPRFFRQQDTLPLPNDRGHALANRSSGFELPRSTNAHFVSVRRRGIVTQSQQTARNPRLAKATHGWNLVASSRRDARDDYWHSTTRNDLEKSRLSRHFPDDSRVPTRLLFPVWCRRSLNA